MHAKTAQAITKAAHSRQHLHHAINRNKASQRLLQRKLQKLGKLRR